MGLFFESGGESARNALPKATARWTIKPNHRSQPRRAPHSKPHPPARSHTAPHRTLYMPAPNSPLDKSDWE